MRPDIDRPRVEAVYEIIKPYLRITPIGEVSGRDFGLAPFPLTFKLELQQHAGSFKTRGAFTHWLTNFIGGVCDFGIDFGEPCPGANTTTIIQDGQPVAEVDTQVLANNPNARREYRALSGFWNIRPPGRAWTIGGNYTYSKTRGNYEGEGQNTPASGSPLGDYVRAVDPVQASPFGYTDDDIRHRLNLFGTYRIDLKGAGGLVFGSVFLYQSALPYSLTASVPYRQVDDYLGAVGTYTFYFGERGSRRFDDVWSLDLSTRYDLPIIRGVGAFLKAAVTNVLNNDRLLKFQTTDGPPSTPTAIPSPGSRPATAAWATSRPKTARASAASATSWTTSRHAPSSSLSASRCRSPSAQSSRDRSGGPGGVVTRPLSRRTRKPAPARPAPVAGVLRASFDHGAQGHRLWCCTRPDSVVALSNSSERSDEAQRYTCG